MKIESNDIVIRFLKSFFRIFSAEIETVNIEGGRVVGCIAWDNEEEKQDFSWNISEVKKDFEEIIRLIDYLIMNNLIEIDMIIISKELLTQKLVDSGWEQENVSTSINSLCSITISMIDEGEETDSFFIHF